MFIARLGRWALPLMLVLFFAGAAPAWQGRPPAAWGSGICPFFGGWAGGWPGMVMGFLFLILVCLAIFHLIRRLVHNTKKDGTPVAIETHPLDILKERYVKGEINGEEFQRIKMEIQ